MKKKIDLSTLPQRPRKEPVYTPREEIALKNADRVVCRAHVGGSWKEQEWFPASGETVLQVLTRIQSELRHSPNLSKVCLYVGGTDPNSGERMIAACPHEWVPEQIRQHIA